MVICQCASFLDRDSGIDSGLTHHVRHAEGNKSGEQACEQTSDQEAACGSHGAGSVAGEAEQVPAVVHPLVHRSPREERGRTLFSGDEVQSD